MKNLLTIFLLPLMLLAAVTAGFSQATGTAELRGQVTDQNGAVVSGATLTVTDAAKGTSRTVTTEDNGSYVILSLLPSVYTVRVEAPNFAAKTYENVELQVGQQLSLDVQLSVGSVGVVIDVTSGEEQLVETERTQQSTVISTRQIENLPINRRNFLDFALLTPGVTDSDNINDSSDARVAQTPASGLSFGGNNGRGNSITVDGAGADTASGGVREVVSQEGVQEFQVNRNSYNAEFGGASGGIVNIVSKTGGNAYHGSGFGLFRDKRFDARNAFDFNPNGKSPFNRQQFGGSFGGKIIENKTFFFVAAEGLREKRTSFVNLNSSLVNGFTLSSPQNNFLSYLSARPGLAPVAAQLRPALTVPSSRTVNLYNTTSGQFPFKATNGVFSTRIDHNFSDTDTAYVRLNYGDSYSENQAAGALTAISRGRLVESRNFGALFSETHQFDSSSINEFKAQFSYYDLFVTPNDPLGPEINIEGFGNFGRDIFLPSRNIDRRYELSDTVSLVRGTHTVKFGGAFLYEQIPVSSETYTGGTFRFGALPITALLGANAAAVVGAINADTTITAQQRAGLLATTINSLQAYSVNAPQVYQQAFGQTSFLRLTSSRYSLFGQDTWKIRPNLTFSYGLRYFLQNEADPVPLDKNNFQPRAGFAWDLFNNGRTVLRGGAGIFTGTIDFQITNVVNTLSSGTNPYNLNIVVATAQTLPNGTGGTLPTSIAIYQSLLSRGIIGTRQITAADVAPLGLSFAPGRPLEARIRLGQNFKNPESYQASLALQHEIGGGMAVEASYLYLRGVHLVRPVDVRPYRVTGVSPYSLQQTLAAIPPTGQLIPRSLDAEYQSVANSFYHAGTLQLTKRFSNNYSINANYTYSKAIDEVTDFNTDFLAQNPFNIRDDRSLSAFDQRHRLVLSGVINSPFENAVAKDFVLSPIFVIGSGRPFNLLIGSDAAPFGNNDSRSLNDRPAAAGRNTGKGDAFYSFDMRLARRFLTKESRYLELTFEAFNLFNTLNFNGVNNIVGTACVNNIASNPNCPASGNPEAANNYIIPINARPLRDRSPTQPLGYTSSSAARQLQFGIRYNF